MKYLRIIFFAVLAFASGCDYPHEKLLNPNYAVKGYNISRGGIQIFSLHYDEVTDAQNFGIADEWITLVSDSSRALVGWTLVSCDSTKQYSLTGLIVDTLRVYTHTAPPSDKKGVSLHLPDSVWIWNNAGHCTAIIDSSDVPVDSLGY